MAKILTYLGNYVDINRLEYGIYLADHPENLPDGTTLDILCHSKRQLASFKADYDPTFAIENIMKCKLITVENG